MCSSLRSAYRINKRNLLKHAIAKCDQNFPARLHHRWVIYFENIMHVVEIVVDVVFETFDRETFIVQVDFDLAGKDAGHVCNAFFHQGKLVCGVALQAKALQVALPGYAGVCLPIIVCYIGLST